MNVEIVPEKTGGEVCIPPSKSIAHRAIIAASLANGTSRIDHVLLSQDIKATIEAVRAYGATVDLVQESGKGIFTLSIEGNPYPETQDVLVNCNESGSTCRFIIPILAIDAENTVVVGEGNLSKRPLDAYFEIFNSQNYEYERFQDDLPLILNDQLEPGTFIVRGDVSSQFITGLFFALPLLEGNSRVLLSSKLESKPYVDLTIDILEKFGIKISEISETEYFVEGNQSYLPANITVEGDYSQAAFWFANGLINKKTILSNLSVPTLQGDSEIISIINKLAGGKILYDKNNDTFISEEAKTHGFVCDVSNTPDLVPILGIIAGLSSGITKLIGGKRLKHKESDRIHSTAEMLRSYGVEATEYNDGLVIRGRNEFTPAEIDSFHDHRIAMAAAIGSGRATGKVVIKDAQCVNKSYPTFWDDFKSLGGDFIEFYMG